MDKQPIKRKDIHWVLGVMVVSEKGSCSDFMLSRMVSPFNSISLTGREEITCPKTEVDQVLKEKLDNARSI